MTRSWRTRSRVRLLAILLLFVSCVGTLRAEDEAPAADLKERAKRYKKDESAHRTAMAEADADRASELAELGIVGVTTLETLGDPARSLDLVIMGDGFTKEEQAEYVKVVDRMAKNYDTPPFDAYASRLNIYRVDLVSPESGISLAGSPVSTPLGGNVKPFVGGKLLRCNVEEALRLAYLAVPEMDYLMVVLNTHGKFVGSANSGRIFLLSTAGGHQRSIVVHEFGHNFGGLYDEYVDPKQAQGRPPPPRLRQGRNVGLESNVRAAKWHYWNIPEAVFRGDKRGKPFQVEDNVRCYEGGATFPDDVYRPEESCHMQRGRGKAFCRACVEGLELALCRFFDPIESVTPPVERVSIRPKDEVGLSIRPVATTGEADETIVRWYLDGARLGKKGLKIVEGRGYVREVRGAVLGEGVHHVTATVDLMTPRVRMDHGRLAASYTWTIEVVSDAPTLALPERVAGDVGTPLEFEAKGEGWTLRHAPDGAVYDEASGHVEWTPAEGQHGAWAFAFAREGGPSAVLSVPARIRPAKKRPNKPPKPVFLAPVQVQAGEVLSFTLCAWDPDGDHLAWSADPLPEGAELDPNTGAFSWKVPRSLAGTRELTFNGTDGLKRLRTQVRVEITGAASFRGILRVKAPDPALCEAWVDRLLLGLHNPQPLVRLANARALRDAPATARLAEALRFWRDLHPDVAGWGRETLEDLFEKDVDDCLDLFLDAMPARVWQFVDRPGDRAFLAMLLEKALAHESVMKDQRRALEALKRDLDLIEAYGKDRLAKEPIPPITDKKYR